MTTLANIGGMRAVAILDASQLLTTLGHINTALQQTGQHLSATSAGMAGMAAGFNAAAKAASTHTQQTNILNQATKQQATNAAQLAALELRVAAAQTDAAGRVKLYTNAMNQQAAGSKEYLKIQLQVISATQALEREQAKATQTSGGVSKLLTGVGGQVLGGLGIAGGISMLTSRLVGLGEASTDLALKAETIGTAYEGATKRAGLASDDLLAKLNAAARGTVTTAELEMSANKALALGVGQSAQQVADLLAIARQKGKDFGEDTNQAFNDITIGLGRLSPRILDNLGIILDENKIYIEYAKSIGVATGKLSDQEKRQALVNELLRTNTDLIAKNANATLDAADKIAAARSRWDEALTHLGKAGLPIVTGIVETGATLLDSVTGNLSAQADALNKKLAAESKSAEDYVARYNAAIARLNPSGGTQAGTTDELIGQYLALKQLTTAEADQIRMNAMSDEGRTEAIRQYQQTQHAVRDTTVATIDYTKALAALKDQLSAAEGNYQKFANAVLPGTRAYEDALAKMNVQQAGAKLEMLRFTEAGGGLSKILDPIQRQIDDTTASTAYWKDQLQQANRAVRDQQDALDAVTEEQKSYDRAVADSSEWLKQNESRLEALQGHYDDLGDAVEDARHKMDALRNTPLVGEAALDDELFAMDQAVKRQQLAIARAEDRGAGKDELKRMNEQLDRLRRAEDEARLAGELRYDAQHRAIDQAGIDRAAQEKTVDQVTAAIAEQQATIDKNTAAQATMKTEMDNVKSIIDQAKQSLLEATGAQRLHNEEVTAAAEKLDDLKKSQDIVNQTYDDQKTKLDDLTKRYQTAKDEALKPYKDAIDAIGTSIDAVQLEHTKKFGLMEHDIDELKKKSTEMPYDQIIIGLTSWGKTVDDLTIKYQNLLDAEKNATNPVLTTPGAGAMPGMQAPFTPQGGTGSGVYSIDAINQILDKTGLAGMGAAIAKFAEEYRVPASLAIAMFRKESSLLTAGSSVSNNNPGNIVYTGGAYGEDRAGGRFGHYPTVEAGVEAYFKLLDREYRRYLDQGNIAGLINKYAPPFENNTTQYIEQINAWMAEYAKSIQAAAMQAASGKGPLETILAALGLEGSQVTTQYSAAHPGLDLAGRDAGSPIHALEGGRVKVSQWNDLYGNMIVIENAITGKMEEYYGHLQDRMVKVGDIIKAGDVIGTLGGTGSTATGVHLHLQMYDENGNLTDPMTEIAKMFGTGQGPTTAQIAGLMAYLQALKDIGDVSYTTAAGMDAVGAGMSIVGPNLPQLADGIAAVGDAAAAASEAIVTATDDILDHVRLIGDLSDKLGYKGGMPDMGYKGATDPFSFSGPDKQSNDPTWGDMITDAATSTVDAVKQVQEVTPLWDVSWQTMGDSTVAALDLAERTAKGASDNIVQYVNGAILRIEALISAIGDIPGIHVDTGTPGPIHGGSPGPSPPGERRPATHHASDMIVPTSKTGGGDTHIWNIDARGSSMNEQQFKKVIDDAMAKRDREFGQRAKGR